MTNKIGLTEEEVKESLKKNGKNKLPERKSKNFWHFMVQQFKNPLVFVLIGVFTLSLIFKEYLDALLIFAVIAVDALMGAIEENNAEKTLVALKNIISQKALVIRNGKRIRIDTTEIVVGDIIIIGAGDKIPADGILKEGVSLKVEEAVLTGETAPVSKKEEEEIFMGTTVVFGISIMEVRKLGEQTEFGKIGKSLEEIESAETPLQIQLKKFAKKLSLIILGICEIIFIIQLLRGEPFSEALRLAIILSIAAIPEGLAIAVTIILSLGTKRVLMKKGLVKNLLSVETLGSTTVICTDKTGTLTEGKMRVVETQLEDEEKAKAVMTLCNEQRTPLELALWNYVTQEKADEIFAKFMEYNQIYDIPFNSENKYSQVAYTDGTHIYNFLMGAPDIIIEFTNLSDEKKGKVKKEIFNLATQGLRLIAFVYKEDHDFENLKNYEWIGFAGVEDPIRETAKEALREAMDAGIEVKIVTGDYLETAKAVAQKIGLEFSDENTIANSELEKLSEKELIEKVKNISVFARVTPLLKLKIVKALQANKQTVAMTGDGVNDAPALKKADIGIVMGNGTDVAKESGDLILLNNSFETIIHCIEEGRLIYSNIVKVVSYVLSNSFAEIVLIIGTIILNLPLPMTIVQILWIHIICDGPLDIVLSFEKNADPEMQKTPTNPKTYPLFSKRTLFIILSVSLSAGLLTLFLFNRLYSEFNNLNLARTISFASLATLSIFYIFSFKDLKKAVWKIPDLLGNKAMNWAIIYSCLLAIAPVEIGFLRNVLELEKLSLINWLEVLGISFIAMFFVEISKVLKLNKN